MRVGLLTSWLSHRGGGVPEALRPLARNLEAQGEGVTVFGLADSSEEALRASWGDTAIRTATPVPPRAFGYAPALAGLLERSGLDVVHVHGLWMYSSLVSMRWHRRWRRPHIISPHGMLDPWAVRCSAWKKRLAGALYERAHLGRAACLHALSEAELRAFRGAGLTNPVCVIPNGIDPPPCRPSAAPAWADRIGGRRVLLFLGRLHPKKGLANLIRACARVQRHPAARDWALVIAGWDQGGHERELRELVEELSLARFVHFVGPQFEDAKAASYARAEAFILPSVSEGLPMAVLEAWSHRLPVLMTEACNLPEGIAAGAALGIEQHVAGIAQGLSELFAMPDAERSRIGARALSLVAERFSWPSVAARMKAVYDWVGGLAAAPPTVVFD
ncbi:MAG TPA: glycosyltransferase [Geminicoccaceae bacterium]